MLKDGEITPGYILLDKKNKSEEKNQLYSGFHPYLFKHIENEVYHCLIAVYHT